MTGCILLLISCKECPTEPEPIVNTKSYHLKLATKFQGCNTVKFVLSSSDSLETKKWFLKRNGQNVSDGSFSGTDTVLTDSTVSVDSTYLYRAYLYRGVSNIIDSSNSLSVEMLSSTNNEFFWTVDTIGYSGFLWDVCAISENDVWVGGDYYVKELDSNNNVVSTHYNAAHWDGTKWKPVCIPVNILGTITSAQIVSILAYSQDEVYFLSNSSLVQWNRTEYIQKVQLWNGMDDPYYHPLWSLWGYLGEYFYAGGREGYMIKTDGVSWERISSFTTRDIKGIAGNSKGKIWATACSYLVGDRGSLHFYNGMEWITIWDKNHPFYPFVSSFNVEYCSVDGICGINDQSVILCVGGYDVMGVIHSQEDFSDYDILFFQNTAWVRAIDGNDINDFFCVGDLNVVGHFNGKVYREYPELAGGGYWEGVDQIGDYVFIAGNDYTPFVAKGIR